MASRILVPWVLPESGREVLKKSKLRVTYLHGSAGELPTLEELIQAVKEVEVLLPRGTQPVPRQVLVANPALLGVANHGVGYDSVDVVSATELGIPVTNTPEILTETTADLAWGLLISTARKIPQTHNVVVSGRFTAPVSHPFMGMDIGPGGSNRPKVLGIIGFGRIGRAVMRRSKGFRMKVIAYDPPLREMIEKTQGVEYRELHQLLKESDFVTLHCPLTKETYHLIGRSELELMKPTAILINASRGPVVDEMALVSVLKEKRIFGAGLDVYEKEPQLTPGLSELENVVLLPHIGSLTQDTRNQMAIVAAKNAVAMAKKKKPRNLVNPEVLTRHEYLQKLSG
jgi:lactate dehydrogenase-like 2-hydroxyacid dehydrogenase